MEEYPEEFRTPPLPLVALIGLPEFHLQVTHYLRAEQPPLATVSLADASGAGSLAGKERRPPDARLPPPLGVLKADWLAKHRQRAASVAVAFVSREKVFGDPNQWLSVCTQIDVIKAAIRGRNIKVVVAIAQATAAPLDVSEERLQALRKRVETEARCCIGFVTGDVAQLRSSLAHLAKLVGELAGNFYREEGRRIKTRIEKKAYSSPELSVRYNFKIAVYAEFRRDWVAAVKYYNAAYTLLHEVPTPPQELQPVQRLMEAKSVAEILHLKLVTLLLHSGNTLEAVTQLRRHMAWYRLREGPPEGSFLHWAWVSKQYKVFGELLQSRLAVVGDKPAGAVGGVVAAVQAGSDREQQLAFYFQAAAACAIKRRQSFESALAIAQAFGDLDQEDPLSGGPENVGAPLYIGQAPRVLNRGLTPETQRPTEAEYVRHALLQERHVAHSQLAIGLLTKAHDQYKKLPHAGRIIYQLGGEMADEYMHTDDLQTSRRLYDSVAALYRRESWALLLAVTLEKLRECTRREGLVQAFVEYSLELASLPLSSGNAAGNGAASVTGDGRRGKELRVRAQEEAFALLNGSGLALERADSGADSSDESRDSERPRVLAVDPASPLLLSVTDTSPLRTVLSCGALFEQRSAQPGQTAKLTIALLSRLPSKLTPGSIELVMSDPACNVSLTTSQPSLNLMDEASASAKEVSRAPEELTLNPLEWRRLSVDITLSAAGRLECQAVILTLGPNTRLRCQVEPLVGGTIPVPFWNYEPRGEGSPFLKPYAALEGSRVLEVGEAQADVDVGVETWGEPGLVGEVLPVQITVTSKGDRVSSGKLTLELVTQTPKPPVSDAPLVDLGSEVPVVEVLPAELLVGKGSLGEGGEQSQSAEPPEKEVPETSTGAEVGSAGRLADTADGNGYETFGGHLAIPELEAGATWAIVLFLRWSQAAEVGLAVAVSYEGEKEGAPVRHAKVRKVVPLKGEEPLSVSHRWIARFRKDALLPGPSTGVPKLPINDEVLLSVSVHGSSSVPVRVNNLVLNLNPSVAEESGKGSTGRPNPADLLEESEQKTHKEAASARVLRPGEAFSQLFRVRASQLGEAVALGGLAVTWQRHQEEPRGDWDLSPAAVTSNLQLDPVSVENPLIVVETKVPAFAVAGKAFTITVSYTNATELLQEVGYRVTDSPSFVIGGSHSGNVVILPRSTKELVYRLVPIQSGLLALPQIKSTAIRLGAKFNPTAGSAKIFVYPPSLQSGREPTELNNGASVKVM